MIKDTTFVLISRGITLVFALAIMIVVARVLGPARKGAYDIVLLVVQTSVLVISCGIGASNIFLGARQPQKLVEFAGNSILAASISGGGIIVILELLMFLPNVQSYFIKNNINILWMRWIVTVIPFILLFLYLQEIIRAAGHIVTYAALSVIQFGINLTLLSSLIFIRNHPLAISLSVWWITQIFIGLSALFLTLRITNFKLRLNGDLFRENLLFGLQLHPGNLAQFLNYRLDIFLVGVFLTSSAVGLYTTATMLAERLWEIPTAIRTALTYHVSVNPQNAVNLTARTCRVIVLVTTPIYFAVLMFAQYGIPFIFGDDYLPTVLPLLLLLPGIWTLSIGKILVIYLSSIGRPIVGTWSALISLLVTFVLDILLIPRMGIAGAAIASSVAYTVSSFVITFIFIQETKTSLVVLLIPNIEDWQLLRVLIVRVLTRFRILPIL